MRAPNTAGNWGAKPRHPPRAQLQKRQHPADIPSGSPAKNRSESRSAVQPGPTREPVTQVKMCHLRDRLQDPASLLRKPCFIVSGLLRHTFRPIFFATGC